MTRTARFPIGTKYLSSGKRKDVCTVVDIYKTYNNAGELVNIRYVATHPFMGQLVPKGKEGSQVVASVGNNVYLYYANGSLFANMGNEFDLFMMPEKRTVWVNFYPHTGEYGEGDCDYWETEEEANKGSAPSRVGGKAYPVEIEV